MAGSRLSIGGGVMGIAEWIRIETIIVKKFGWKLGIQLMVNAKNKVSDDWLDSYSTSQTAELRRLIRELIC
jgi:hypothetical protein